MYRYKILQELKISGLVLNVSFIILYWLILIWWYDIVSAYVYNNVWKKFGGCNNGRRERETEREKEREREREREKGEKESERDVQKY